MLDGLNLECVDGFGRILLAGTPPPDGFYRPCLAGVGVSRKSWAGMCVGGVGKETLFVLMIGGGVVVVCVCRECWS